MTARFDPPQELAAITDLYEACLAGDLEDERHQARKTQAEWSKLVGIGRSQIQRLARRERSWDTKLLLAVAAYSHSAPSWYLHRAWHLAELPGHTIDNGVAPCQLPEPLYRSDDVYQVWAKIALQRRLAYLDMPAASAASAVGLSLSDFSRLVERSAWPVPFWLAVSVALRTTPGTLAAYGERLARAAGNAHRSPQARSAERSESRMAPA